VAQAGKADAGCRMHRSPNKNACELQAFFIGAEKTFELLICGNSKDHLT
jgi:hypothetical protein